MKSIKDTIEKVLYMDVHARNDDIYLDSVVLQELNYPTDLCELWKVCEGKNILATIERARRELQAGNPELKASRNTAKRRELLEKEIREYFRG